MDRKQFKTWQDVVEFLDRYPGATADGIADEFFGHFADRSKAIKAAHWLADSAILRGKVESGIDGWGRRCFYSVSSAAPV